MVLVMMKKRQESDTAALSDVYPVQAVKASRPKSTSLFTVDVNSDWFYAFILTEWSCEAKVILYVSYCRLTAEHSWAHTM